MKPFMSIGTTISRVPGALRRRVEPRLTRHAPVSVGNLRRIDPMLPREPDADQLMRAARRIVRRAARDEFAREGVRLIRLPEGWGRAELRQADIAGDAAFHGFVEGVLAAVDIAPSAMGPEDVEDLRTAPESGDAYGYSLEAAADLASYLLSRAWRLMAKEADSSEAEFFAAQHQVIRDDVRSALVRLVRVPLEVRVALERHEALAGEGVHPGPERFEPGEAEADTEKERSAGPGLSHRVRTAYRFVQSDEGKATFGMLKDGAGRAYELYGKRVAAERSRGQQESSAPDDAPPDGD